eukprot:CAMPEP_0119490220 /NCGR_PEP_ID=MMETSP1344-20130328/15462_1 /TAXON_ID=236787 /ORGANISM="Florenciella parvula, Strain CCMP2471" /LENGTH=31 /DNA_ID= /DNA_START= /DNA_END= /DNA_ORIENTATION=
MPPSDGNAESQAQAQASAGGQTAGVTSERTG